MIQLCLGVLDGNIAGGKIGFIRNQITLRLVETGQLCITGTVFIIHQVALFGGEITDLFVQTGLFDIFDVVGISGADLSHNGKPLSGDVIIGNSHICLIFTHGVVACQTVEKSPVDAESVADGRNVSVVIVLGDFPVTVIVGSGAETHVKESADGGGVGTVSTVHVVAGSLELCAVSFEVGTVGKSRIEIDLNSGKLVEIQIQIDGELDIGRESSLGIAHKYCQSVKRSIVIVVGSDHINVSTVHLDLEVENVAQRNGTCLELVVGIFQRDLLEFSVFFSDPALSNGEKHVVVCLSHSVHHLAAVVGIHGFLVFEVAFLSHDVELSGKTVKEHPVDVESQIRCKAVGLLVTMTVNVSVPGMAFCKSERGVHSGRPGSHGLIVAEPCRFNGMVSCDVGGVVFQSDLLSLSKGQLFNAFKKLV